MALPDVGREVEDGLGRPWTVSDTSGGVVTLRRRRQAYDPRAGAQGSHSGEHGEWETSVLTAEQWEEYYGG